MNALLCAGSCRGFKHKESVFSQALWRQRTRWPGILARSRVRAVSATEGCRQPSWSRHADLLLEPEVHEVHWDDFASVDQAHAAGVEAMRRALPELRELLDRRSRCARPEEPSGAVAKRGGLDENASPAANGRCHVGDGVGTLQQDPFIFCYRIAVEPVRIFLGRFGTAR